MRCLLDLMIGSPSEGRTSQSPIGATTSSVPFGEGQQLAPHNSFEAGGFCDLPITCCLTRALLRQSQKLRSRSVGLMTIPTHFYRAFPVNHSDFANVSPINVLCAFRASCAERRVVRRSQTTSSPFAYPLTSDGVLQRMTFGAPTLISFVCAPAGSPELVRTYIYPARNHAAYFLVQKYHFRSFFEKSENTFAPAMTEENEKCRSWLS